MNKTPFFSVITASFNSEKTISKTIESLLNQTYTGFEYIIIDGNSNDSTVEIIKSFEGKFKEKNIKVLPGSFLGRNGLGKGYIRIALVENEEKTREVLTRLKDFING